MKWHLLFVALYRVHIYTVDANPHLRQAHSKPNKAGLTHEQIPKRAGQFS
jgi:hypothetical protein